MVKSDIDRGFGQPLRLTGVLLAWNLAKFCRRGMCQYAGFGGFYLALACVLGETNVHNQHTASGLARKGPVWDSQIISKLDRICQDKETFFY